VDARPCEAYVLGSPRISQEIRLADGET